MYFRLCRECAFAALIILTLIGVSTADETEAGPVVDLIFERLSLMKQVAAFKFQKGLEIEDLAREALVLDKAASEAAEAGLEVESIRPFFQALIEAAKTIQECWIKRWQSKDAVPPNNPPNLMVETRPELIRLGKAIIAGIKAGLAEDSTVRRPRNVTTHTVLPDCLDKSVRGDVLKALADVKLSK